MRKLMFLALTLLTVVSATFTLPRPAEAACSWQCGECGAYCPCARCFGPPPPCVCT
jgi:heterodisulfide reductase subunit C